MSNSGNGHGFSFEGPAIYRIVVQGRLDEDMSDRLAGMRIEAMHGPDQASGAKLVGRLRDQTQLSGVLNTLYELHLSVLEVKKLDDE